MISNIFSHPFDFFIFLKCPQRHKIFLMLMNSDFSTFPLVSCALGVISKKLLQTQGHEDLASVEVLS